MHRSSFRSGLFLGAAIVCATASPAMANTDSEDGATPQRDYLPAEIVVTGERAGYDTADGSTATKTPTPLIDVPQSATFITEDQLEDQSIRQLGEALRFVPGISLESGEGHRDEIFIRGQETTADFYLDGLRDDAQYYRSLYNISRVEVLKGANALIFGRGGGGGVVNRVSKKAQTNEGFGQFDASLDTFGAFALLADVNQPLTETVGLRLNATYEEFDNNRDFYEGRFIGISPTLGVDIGPDTRLDVSYTYDDDRRTTDRGVPSFQGGPLTGYDDTFFGDPDFNRSTIEAHIARARVTHRLSPAVSVNAALQYANYDKAYANILPRGTDGTSVSLGGYADATQRENLIGQANLVAEFDTGQIGHTLLVGIEGGRQDTQNSRDNVTFAGASSAPLAETIFVPPFTTAPSRARDSDLTTFSAYVQDQIAIGDFVELVAGLRFDRFDLDTVDLVNAVDGSRVDEQFSPRVGLIVKPVENVSLYAAYSESFLPQAGDQFVILSPGDAAFEPEQFTNYEIGAKWAIGPRLLAAASIFRLERENTTAPDPNNTGLTLQTGASRTEGFEISLTGEILPFWEASLGYTYLDGEITETTDAAVAGTRLQQLPEHQITAWNRFNLTDRLGVGAGLIYQGEQFASFSQNVTLPDYVRVDAAIFYDVTDRIAVQVNVENLFDETYYPSAHGDNNIQPGRPFSARFGVRLKM
ncbi:TonB-dependent siderophore receptor [Citromicrobium sp. WPS32]|uniref:TonB-dependent receptor n=1 Tax=Citromicrobium sp. WPS32 TaxID=1634517 RepID=UPI0006C9069B|nr:TonB-dependent siderophore receptor [Citromicrobium sp. WPS32]KPM15928.1 TonB-dependent receptor [Citromicrobium sp. WPS32]MAY78804.1 TonB-dependent siderophore receptor [Citromicrobium sp.]|tara:strand:- start:295 stop:2394 length:2100 start_codon:yes stop_codon:yes gene_type:complete